MEIHIQINEAIEKGNYLHADSLCRKVLGFPNITDNPDDGSGLVNDVNIDHDLSKSENILTRLGLLKIFVHVLVLRGDPKSINEAIIQSEAILNICLDVYGINNTSKETISAMLSLASVLRKGRRDQIEEAEQVYTEVLNIISKSNEEIRKKFNADIATALMGLGIAIEAQGNDRLSEAKACYMDALSIRRSIFGEISSETGESLLYLASLLCRMNDNNGFVVEAIIRYEQALSIFISLYGGEHQRVTLCRDSIRLLLQKQSVKLLNDRLYAEAAVCNAAAEKGCSGAAIVSGYFAPPQSHNNFNNNPLFCAIYPCFNSARLLNSSASSDSVNMIDLSHRRNDFIFFWAINEEGGTLSLVSAITSWFASRHGKKNPVMPRWDAITLIPFSLENKYTQIEVKLSPDSGESQLTVNEYDPVTNTSNEFFSAMFQNLEDMQNWKDALDAIRGDQSGISL